MNKMNKITDIQAAEAAGTTTAEYITDSYDADNWRELLPTDNIPEEDYRALKSEFGEVTREMEAAYKKSFNAAYHATNDKH